MKKLLLLVVLVFGLHAESVTKLKKACDQNDAVGCTNLGALYANGTGVKKIIRRQRSISEKAVI